MHCKTDSIIPTKNKRACIYYAMLIFAVSCSCLGQKSQGVHIDETTLSEEWRWVEFTTESGLPSDQINSLVETSDGNIWVGTAAGVAWYDGYFWNPIDPSLGLPQQPVSSLDRWMNSIVVKFEDGSIYRGNKNGFRYIDLKGKFPNEIVPFGYDRLLFRVDTLIYFYEEGKIKIFDPSRNLIAKVSNVPHLFMTKGDNVWLNTPKGLYKWVNTAWRCRMQAIMGELSINCLIEDEKGTGLASIGNPFGVRGLWEWYKQSQPVLNPTEKGDWIKAMDIAPNGQVLALYRSGEILIRDLGKWAELTPLPPQMKNIEFLQFRANGDLWVGARRGLFLFNQHSTRWTYVKQNPPFKNRVLEVMKTKDGSLWLATADGVEIHTADGKIENITNINGQPIYEVTGLVEDDEGNVWISSGSSLDGTYRWDGSSWKYYRVDKKIQWLRFHKIRKDRHGRLWFLRLSKEFSIETDTVGVYIYENKKFRPFGKSEGLLSDRVYAFAERGDGALWFGTSKGVSCLKEGAWTHWTVDTELKMKYIFTLAIDHENQVWFADRSSGVAYIDMRGDVKHFTTKDGLPSNKIWDLAVDPLGRLWVTTEAGLCSYNHGIWNTFDSRSGLTTAHLWPVYPAPDKIYVGTTGSGLAILNLQECDDLPPKITLFKPVVEGNTVLLRFLPIAFWGKPSPNDILTRYRSNDSKWSEWSTSHSFTLDGFEPGEYSYQVQAKNLFGDFDVIGKTGYFSIAPPLYMRPNVWIPTVTLIFIVVYLGAAYIIRKRKHDRALRESETKFRCLIESTFEGIAISQDGIVLDVNESLTKMLEYTSSELKSKSLVNWTTKESHELFLKNITAESEKPFEVQLVRKDTSIIWVEIIARTIPYEGRKASVIAIRNITERKQDEKKLFEYQGQLRSLASELSITEERERRRMAAFLHDSIGQLLAFCKIKLGSLQLLTSAGKDDKGLREIREFIEQAIQNTRSLTFDLSPPILYELGFEAAVESLAEQMEGQHGIRITVVNDKNPKPLNNELRVLLYSAVRELLANVVKHARAQKVEISLSKGDDSIRIDVSDNGKGFNPSVIAVTGAKSTGFGLFNIKENLHHFGGNLEIHSVKGRGTRVSITAPLHNAENITLEKIYEHSNRIS